MSVSGEERTSTGVAAKIPASISAIPAASSVTSATDSQALISSESNRSPAPSRTQSTFSSIRSGSASCAAAVSISPEWIDALTPTMSAFAPAKRRTRLPPPAMMIGGPPARNGFGDPSRPVIV